MHQREELLFMDNPKGNHAIHEACDENHVSEEQKLEVIKILYEKSREVIEDTEIQVRALEGMNNEGCTPLMLASRSGYEDIARWLIGNGVNIHDSDMDDWVSYPSN